jgi:glycosyltransferase involved in cell wall biosynthesis
VPHGLRITAIVAAYNEADIIGQSVGDLVRQGIHVYVLDNLSTDGTRAALQPFAASGLIRVEQFPAGEVSPSGAHRYEHGRIMLRKQELACELDSDWFISHDADEFRESPWTHLSLREGIERVDRSGWNAIDFTVLNFWPTDDRAEAGDDVRAAFRYYEAGGPWDRAQVKCWKKAPDVELVSSAGHDAQFASRRVFPIRFILRHYPIRSQEHGLRKILEERKPRFPEEERQRGWHVQYDDISAGHRFLRDPRTLTEFDPDRVRVESLIRDIGELQTMVDRHQQQSAELQTRIDSQVAQIELLVQRHKTDVERLSTALAECDATTTRLRAAIDALERDLADLRASRSWKVTAPLRALWRLLGRQ